MVAGSVGRLQYDGYLSETSVPSYNKETHSFSNVDVKFGAMLFDTDSMQLIPYGGLGFRYWKQQTGHEYYNFKAIIGVKINWALVDNLVVSPYFNIGTIFDGHALLPMHKLIGGRYIYQGKGNLKLGNRPIYEFGLEMNYRLDHEIFLVAGISHIRFGYGKSASQTVGLANGYEPESKTREMRYSIGIRFGFL